VEESGFKEDAPVLLVRHVYLLTRASGSGSIHHGFQTPEILVGTAEYFTVIVVTSVFAVAAGAFLGCTEYFLQSCC